MRSRTWIVTCGIFASACGGETSLRQAEQPDAWTAADVAPPAPADAGVRLPDAAPLLPDATAAADAAEVVTPDAGPELPRPDGGGCASPGLTPGDHLFRLEHGGRTREYELHVPPSYTGSTALPVVLYLHPLGTTRRYLQRAGTPEKADAEGFLAAYPDGIGSSWNGGACCGPANGAGLRDEVDDVGFIRAVVAHLGSVACVDPSRVYATGHSNGGFLSHRLACDAADLIAAIAPVSSVNGLPDGACMPSRPVPVFAVNGTEDNLVPYAGGFGFPGVTLGEFRSVAATVALWAAADGCTGEPVVSFENGVARCETYTTCAGGTEVTQCTITGGGHCWFGEPLCLGTNPSDLIATDATWAFLSRFRKP